jgi:hypothetical protein
MVDHPLCVSSLRLVRPGLGYPMSDGRTLRFDTPATGSRPAAEATTTGATHAVAWFRGEDDIVMAHSDSKFGDDWEVVVAKAYDPGNADNGAEETVIVGGPEGEARRVYANTIAVAADRRYQYVRLRSKGRDVESWPPATGWTS